MKSDTYFVQAKEYAAELRLGAIKSDLEESISDAENNNLSYEEFLCRLLQKESDIRKYNLTQSRIKTASFPYKKYLEDIDIGYRARIHGYRNVYAPKAIVYHVGSGFSGSAHNAFKVKLSSRNNVYLAYKNMPFLQIILNSPFLLLGHAVKYLFFLKKGLGKEYARGLKEGMALCSKENKVRFSWKNLPNYGVIQLELWLNMIRRLI